MKKVPPSEMFRKDERFSQFDEKVRFSKHFITVEKLFYSLLKQITMNKYNIAAFM